jgi:hypothetical protein
METRFSHDFSRVRIHTDARAAESARRVNARAYTVGQHIVFDHGQYNHDTPEGLHLMAHELAHTVQQGEGPAFQRAGDLTVAAANDPLEREADAAADHSLHGFSTPILGRSPDMQLQRVPWGPCPNGTVIVQGGERNVKEIYITAEETIVRYYIRNLATDTSRVFSNVENLGTTKLKDTQINDPFIYRTKVGFFSELVPDETGGELSEDVKEAGLKPVKGATKEPDILDFNTMEVYDVTTEAGAQEKGSQKIPEYLRLLNESLKVYKTARQNVLKTGKASDYPEPPRPQWRPGTKLQGSKPPENIFLFKTKPFQYEDQLKSNVWVCYGPTNLSGGPKGVIAYRAIDRPPGTPGQDQPGYETIPIKAAGTTFQFNALPTGKTDLESSTPNEKTAIFGLRLRTIDRHKGRPDVIEAERFQESPLLQPFKFATPIKLNRSEDGTLAVTSRTARFFVKYLSEGTATLTLTDQGLTGRGPLDTTSPLLRKAPIQVEFDNEHVAAVLEGNPQRIQPSIPGVKITEASLSVNVLPELSAKGTLGVAFGPPKKPLADGALTITADANGLVIDGKIDVHIPGVDQAEGHITYRDGHLTGNFTISTEQLRGKIPGVTGASLTGGFNDQGISLEGSVDLKLPGDQPAKLSVKKKGDHFVYTGEASFAVPGIDPVKATVSYDGEHFEGSGETGFDIKGIHGTIKAKYRDGKITGTGKAGIEKGRVKGDITVTLHEDNTLTGEGMVTVQITDNLVGTVGVALDANKKVHVKGAIEFPKPITLFERFPRAQKDQDKELFNYTQNIGIPGLSIGPVGVVAHIGARLGFTYYVGPGELRDVKLEAGFDPLEETKNLSVHGHAALVIPAHAGVYLVLEGGLGVSAGIAEATGGLTVRGDVGIDGGLTTTVDIDYHDGRFAVDAEAAIRGGLSLRLALGAYVDAHVGIGPLEAGYRKDWELKAYVWNGPSFGVVFPLHYASDEPFQAPSLDQIRFEKPNVDVNGLLGSVFGSSQSSEKPSPG